MLRGVAQVVERLVRDQEAGSSSLLTPTKYSSVFSGGEAYKERAGNSIVPYFLFVSNPYNKLRYIRIMASLLSIT